MSKLSVVLPAYNEELMISGACRALRNTLEEADIVYELVFVNDGSSDHTWEEIKKEGKRDSRVGGISFSRNFGKEAAIYAGLAHATGEVIAVMDCDLQHPPQTLVEMYRLWEEGFEIIEGKKKNRGAENMLRKKSSRIFYRIMSGATGLDMENTSDFKMMDRKVAKSILSMPERNMFFRATTGWVGFRSTEVSFEVQERQAGRSKWSTASLIRYAFQNIVSFTTVPLQFVSMGGGICFVCSLILMFYSLIQFLRGHAVEGYTTTIMVLLLIGSAVMLSLGVIGYYVARIYEEVRKRPRYILSEVFRLEGHSDWNENVTEREETGRVTE